MSALHDLKEIVKNAGCSYISGVKTYTEQKARYAAVVKLVDNLDRVVDEVEKAISIKAADASTIVTFPDGLRADVVTLDELVELVAEVCKEAKELGFDVLGK